MNEHVFYFVSAILMLIVLFLALSGKNLLMGVVGILMLGFVYIGDAFITKNGVEFVASGATQAAHQQSVNVVNTYELRNRAISNPTDQNKQHYLDAQNSLDVASAKSHTSSK